MEGIIFDIKEFTVHDGPGSRITVFLKGCPLRCKWCHNPEGLNAERQLMYKENFCTHCGACYTACEHEECKTFGRCIHACANGCLSIVGEVFSSDILARRLLQYADILRKIGGGITISGGEVMMQAAFVCELAKKLGSMHKTVQTSGYATPDIYQQVVEHFDYVMQDIKIVDREAHIRYTGASNEMILENVEWLKNCGRPFVFRVPLIPGITDTEKNLREIADIVGKHRVELMPYNVLAGAKYGMVGMVYTLPEVKNRKEDFTKYFQNAVLLK